MAGVGAMTGAGATGTRAGAARTGAGTATIFIGTGANIVTGAGCWTVVAIVGGANVATYFGGT